MKWFKHDSNAHSDAKLQELKLRYGMQGYGVYWYCLELIAANVDKHNTSFELEHSAELIAATTGIESDLIHQMLSYIVELGLFKNINGKIVCTKMASRTDEYTQKIIRQQKPKATNNNDPDCVGTKSDLIEENRKENNILENNKIKKNRREKNIPTSQAHSMGLQGKKINQDTAFNTLEDTMDYLRVKHGPNRSNDSQETGMGTTDDDSDDEIPF